MQGESVSLRLKLAASAYVSPLLLAPAITVAAMFWARAESIRLHPEAAASNPPTVSRAIADPIIGDVFALWMFLVAALQAFAILRLVQAMHRSALQPYPRRNGALLYGLLGSAVLCQIVAIAGAITLSQYTGFYSDDLHTLGSYMLFLGNGSAILFCGLFATLDGAAIARGEADSSVVPRPYHFYLHTRLAWIITAVGVVFFVLYTWFDYLASFNDYGLRVAFVVCELALLISSLLYLGSFAVTLYRHELHVLTRNGAARARPPVGGEISPPIA